MKYLSLILIGSALFGASCNAQDKTSDGFTKLPGGLEYKTIVKGTDTQTARSGDIAELNVIMKMGDSVVINTREINGGQPVKQGLTEPREKGDLMTGLLLMHAGDSTVFRMNADTLAALSHQPKPTWIKDGQNAVWEVKMVSLMTREQNEAAMSKAAEAQKGIDDATILKYFKEHNITGYQKTASGLYYVVHQEGNGASPQKGQKATVNYTGQMLNGDVFDSNTDPKFHHVQPFDFPLGQGRVIKGWDEGVSLMKKGEKATFYIPSELAYGQQGAGGRIPPNAVLIFDIELVSFQ